MFCFVFVFAFFIIIRIAALSNCDQPLGMEDGRITDSQITASSQFNSFHAPKYARLNFVPSVEDVSGGWSAFTNDVNQWIQVDLSMEFKVAGVIIQGRDYWHQQWVTQYKVQYSDDGSTWNPVLSEDQTEVSFVRGLLIEAYF